MSNNNTAGTANSTRPTFFASFTNGYSNALQAGFEDHGIFVGTIVLVWNTIKFLAIFLAFLLTLGLVAHGWLRTNSALYNTVHDTSPLEVASQDTLINVSNSIVKDYDNSLSKLSNSRRKNKAREDNNTAELDALLNRDNTNPTNVAL